MREITISTEVFARIWSLREEGEESEEDILRRILWADWSPGRLDNPTPPPPSGGLRDQRFRVTFPEGFQIERTYLGKKYRASVDGGQWVIEGLRGRFSKLNELSRAIGTKTENAWVNWFFTDNNGERRPVSDLRNPNRIATRSRRIMADDSEESSGNGNREENQMFSMTKVRWCDDVHDALQVLGGEASLGAIYKEVERIRRKAGRSVPPSIEATIRRTLEDFSSDSENFRGEDWFAMPEGKGSGVWALRKR